MVLAPRGLHGHPAPVPPPPPPGSAPSPRGREEGSRFLALTLPFQQLLPKKLQMFLLPPPQKKKQPLEEEEPKHQRVSSLHWPDLNRLSLSVCPSVLQRETLTEPLPSFKITSPGRARATRGGEHDPGEIILTQTPLLCLARQERFQAQHIRHVIPIAIAPRRRQQQ